MMIALCIISSIQMLGRVQIKSNLNISLIRRTSKSFINKAYCCCWSVALALSTLLVVVLCNGNHMISKCNSFSYLFIYDNIMMMMITIIQIAVLGILQLALPASITGAVYDDGKRVLKIILIIMIMLLSLQLLHLLMLCSKIYWLYRWSVRGKNANISTIRTTAKP